MVEPEATLMGRVHKNKQANLTSLAVLGIFCFRLLILGEVFVIRPDGRLSGAALLEHPW